MGRENFRLFLLLFVGAIGITAAALDAPAQAAPIHPAIDVDRDDLECLALTIYWESRGQGPAAQNAVAFVVLNRVADPAFPDTICGVAKQGGTQRYKCQFTWYCDGRSDVPTEKSSWREAQARARGALQGRLKDPTFGATYFHHVRVSPSWRGSFEQTAQLGPHLFYR